MNAQERAVVALVAAMALAFVVLAVVTAHWPYLAIAAPLTLSLLGLIAYGRMLKRRARDAKVKNKEACNEHVRVED